MAQEAFLVVNHIHLGFELHNFPWYLNRYQGQLCKVKAAGMILPTPPIECLQVWGKHEEASMPPGAGVAEGMGIACPQVWDKVWG